MLAPGAAAIPPNGQLRVGTSGYSYKEWKGSFYPQKLPDKEMLRFYASQFPTVEINHTFYRMPAETVLEQWAAAVPAEFQFALKLNQKITHIQKLKGSADTLKRFLEAAAVLQAAGRLGPLLAQVPPSFPAGAAVLEEFLALRPPAFRLAFEVRHASWHSEAIYELLRRHDTALCLAETDAAAPPETLTAGFAYVRLRREAYTPAQLDAWRARFDAWTARGVDVYCYIKHEDAGRGPAYARHILGRDAPGA